MANMTIHQYLHKTIANNNLVLRGIIETDENLFVVEADFNKTWLKIYECVEGRRDSFVIDDNGDLISTCSDRVTENWDEQDWSGIKWYVKEPIPYHMKHFNFPY